MTDHLDEAAAKAVTAAGRLLHDDDPKDRVEAAAHLTYLAGLIRGGAVRSPKVSTWTTADEQYTMPRQWLNEVVSEQAAGAPTLSFALHEERLKVQEWAEATEHARAQRDELLAAARKFLAEQTPGAELALDELVTKLEAE
jgi:hypothetical protein